MLKIKWSDCKLWSAVHEALRYSVSLIFNVLLSLVKNSQLYILKFELEILSEVTKCQWEKGKVPVVFWKVYLSAMSKLEVMYTTAEYSKP